MSQVSVRPADSADVPAIRRIAETGWREAYDHVLSPETIDEAMSGWYDPESIREFVADDDVGYFVAERDGDVVGYVSGGPREGDDVDQNEAVATLGAIYVDPRRWGEGIGTTLLEHFESFCREAGFDAIRVRVLAENEVGAPFYRTHDFAVVEETESELFGERVREYRFRGDLN